MPDQSSWESLDLDSLKKITVKRGELAEALCLDPRYINMLQQEGVIEKVGRGQYPLFESIRRYSEYKKNGGQSNSENNKTKSKKEEADARLKDAQAKRMERINSVAEKELMPVEDVENAVRGFCVAMSRILEVIPHRLKRKFPDSLTHKHLKLIDGEIRRVQNLAAKLRIDNETNENYLDEDDELIEDIEQDMDGELV